MKRSDAQEKIRSHLDKRSNHSVTVTERLIRYWWKICNIALFHKKLYPPQITIKNLKKDWGYCKPLSNGEVEICIATEHPNRAMVFSTLVHEMVHQWECQTYGRMGHGKRYGLWQKRIDRYLGLDIHGEDEIDEEYIYGQTVYRRRHQSTK